VPLFDAGELRCCVTFFDTHTGQPDDVDRLAHRYDSSANPVSAVIWKLFPAIGLLLFVPLAALIPARLADFTADGTGRFVAVLLVVELVLGFAVWLLLLVTGGLWERQFLGSIAKTVKVAGQPYGDHHRLIAATNFAGRAARYLFKHLQGRRRTWVAPPAVADSALSLAHPLIDVAFDLTSPRRTLHVYTHFLYYAAGLVVVERFDLIPALREYYEREHALARRTGTDSDGVPERDALFIDPMRDHHRWLVLKEYLFPLAAWLSLAVSVAALVVSLRG
jgi:hypothetical protein